MTIPRMENFKNFCRRRGIGTVGIEFAVRRGYLLIGRQLDFRVAYRRGTHRASRLRRPS